MSVFGDRLVKARVDYFYCDYCGKKILKGEKYFRAACNDAEKIHAVKMHKECSDDCIKRGFYLGWPFTEYGVMPGYGHSHKTD